MGRESLAETITLSVTWGARWLDYTLSASVGVYKEDAAAVDVVSLSLLLFIFISPTLQSLSHRYIAASSALHSTEALNHIIQRQCLLPQLRPSLTRPQVVVVLLLLLIVRDIVVPILRVLSVHDAQGADHSVGATSSDSTRKSSYQLRQYAKSPRREDPYTPGRGNTCRTATVISELDVVSALLHKTGNAFKL
jgi:hypothetical protein